MRRFLMAAAMAGLAMAPAWAQDSVTLKGRVAIPPGASAQGAVVRVYEAPAPIVENAVQEPAATADVKPDGRFDLEYAPTEKTELEIVGPEVRRARFPWPGESQAGTDAVFRFDVERGVESALTVTDLQGAPLAGVLIGPVMVLQDEGASEGLIHYSHAFFAQTGSDGRASLPGLNIGARYQTQLFAPGYERKRVSFGAGETVPVELKSARFTVTGQVVGSKSYEPQPGLPVLVMGKDAIFEFRRNADAEGNFILEGLPEDTYEMIADVPMAPPAIASEVYVGEGAILDDVLVFAFEGIDIGGTVVDVETGEPIPGATVDFAGVTQAVDPEGGFFFERYKGPWPALLDPKAPNYKYDPALDQEDNAHNVTNGAEDKTAITLNLRRLRVLEILANLDSDGGAMLELRQPDVDKLEETRRRVTGPRNVIELRRSGPLVAWLRASDGTAVSDLTTVDIPFDATTTTLPLTLGPGATLAGSLAYADEETPRAPKFTLELRATGVDTPEPVVVVTASGDSEGAFTLEGLPPGDFEAVFQRAEGEPYLTETVTLERNATTRLDRQVIRGETASGVVLNSERQPVGNARVALYGIGTDGASLHLNKTTGEDGKFAFEDLGGLGVKELKVEHDDYEPKSLTNLALPAEDMEVVLTDRAGVTVRLAGTPEALNGARAHLMVGRMQPSGAGGDQWVYMNESQRDFFGAETVTLLPMTNSRYRVAARIDSAWDVSPAFEWTRDGEGKEITLTPGVTGQITAIVSGERTAEELAALDIVLLNTALPEGPTDVEFRPQAYPPNELVFADLPAGEYMLIGYSENLESVTETNIDLATGERKRLELEMSAPDGTLEVIVLRGGDKPQPASGARVVLYFNDVPEPDPLMEETTDGEGRASLFPLSGGREYLAVVTDGQQTQRFPIRLGGAEQTVRLVLSRPVTVSLIVPSDVRQLIESAPGVPLLFRSRESGETTAVGGENVDAPVDMAPGAYDVDWGETPLGSIDVPQQGGSVRIPGLT
ncbi:MAG: hypothetical protein RLY93_01945 [Sumerlaeia bacterium]